MKNILFSFFILLSILAHSQRDAIVYYRYKQPYIEFDKERVLVIDGSKSKYTYHQEYEKVNNGNSGYERFYKHFDIYFDERSKSMTCQNILEDGTKLIAKWTQELVWEITSETDFISGHKVQKAICKDHLENHYENDDWNDGVAHVWFTTDIPIQSGPMGFVGLPGLVLKVEFTESNYTYEFDKIVYEESEISIPTDGIEVSKQESIVPTLIKSKWLKEQKKLQQSND